MPEETHLDMPEQHLFALRSGARSGASMTHKRAQPWLSRTLTFGGGLALSI